MSKMITQKGGAGTSHNKGRRVPQSRVKEDEHMNRNWGNIQATVQVMVRRMVRAPLQSSGTVGRPWWRCGTGYVPPLSIIVRSGKNVK
jgi:hypothetical protein